MIRTFAIFTNKQFQCIVFSHFNSTLGMNLLIPILPVFLKNSGFSETQIGFIMGITAASALLIRPWVGLQTDTKGSRPVVLIGQILLIISTIGFWWISTFWGYLSLRLLFGLALAFYGTGAVTFASSIGTGETNVNAIAMYTLSTMMAVGIGMSSAQIAFDNMGFKALIGMCSIFIFMAFLMMKFRAEPISLGTSQGSKVPFMTVLKSKTVLSTTLCQFAASFSAGAAFTFLPLASLAQGVHFFSLFFISFAVAVVYSRFFVQKFNNRFGLEKSSIYACLTICVSVLLPLIPLSPVILIVSGLLFGLGFGIVFPTLVLLLVSRISKENRGTSLSILIAAGDIGNALSTTILGGVAENLGYPVLFITTAVIVFLCTYAFGKISSAARRPVHG